MGSQTTKAAAFQGKAGIRFHQCHPSSNSAFVIWCVHTPAVINSLWFSSISRQSSQPYTSQVCICRKSLCAAHRVYYCQNNQNVLLQLQKVTYTQDTWVCHNSTLFLWYVQCSLKEEYTHPNTLHTFHLPWIQSDLHITGTTNLKMSRWSYALLQNFKFIPAGMFPSNQNKQIKADYFVAWSSRCLHCWIQLLFKSKIKLNVRIESTTESKGTWQDYFPTLFAKLTTNFCQMKQPGNRRACRFEGH